MKTEETAVLVVGGSLVGLSAAMFLGAKKVRTVLVEPHLGSSPHPRAIGYTQRTMELFRELGIADRIPEAPPSFRLRRRKVESLAGTWSEETDWTPQAQPRPAQSFSPHSGAAIAQDTLEPLLRERARELGAELRLGTRLISFEQDANGVTALLEEVQTGRRSTLRAKYLLACDGSRSGVREALKITRSGRGEIQTLRSVLFRADLERFLESGVSQFEIEQPGLRAFLTTYGDGRWVLMFHDDLERDEATLRACIRQAAGLPDLKVEIITTGRWVLSAQIADRFSEGRVFLAGDAAHTLPPTRGGFGANTGIHDVHNLAWKLAAVLKGDSSPALLETYDAERRPVAWERLLQTFARPDYARFAEGIADGVKLHEDIAMELGQLYRSKGILGAGPELPSAARPDEWKGQPGTRAPHVSLATGKSSLDLFGDGWVLLTARALEIDSGLTVLQLGRDFGAEDSAALSSAFGLSADGACLVRPDGHIAWRSESPSAESVKAALAAAAFSEKVRSPEV